MLFTFQTNPDVHAVSHSKGQTAQHVLCESRTEDTANLVKVLLQNGVDPKAVDHDGNTAFHTLAQSADHRVKRILNLLLAGSATGKGESHM